MLLKLALVRCGRTDSDDRGLLLGLRDEQLSPDGRKEIEQIAKGNRPKAELVFSDKMIRCRESAELLYPGNLVVIERNLRPFDYGEFEGKTLAELQRDEKFQHWVESVASPPCPGGENAYAFGMRCLGALRSIVGELSVKGIEQAAVVTHGAVISAMLQRICVPRSEYRDWEPGFGKGYFIELDSMNSMARVLFEI